MIKLFRKYFTVKLNKIIPIQLGVIPASIEQFGV